MKKYLFFASIVLLTSCSTSYTATDSQRNWCYRYGGYGSAQLTPFFTDEQLALWSSLRQARDLYEIDTGIEVNLSQFKENIGNKLTNELELCKVWADMNDID